MDWPRSSSKKPRLENRSGIKIEDGGVKVKIEPEILELGIEAIKCEPKERNAGDRNENIGTSNDRDLERKIEAADARIENLKNKFKIIKKKYKERMGKRYNPEDDMFPGQQRDGEEDEVKLKEPATAELLIQKQTEALVLNNKLKNMTCRLKLTQKARSAKKDRAWM